MSRTLVTGAAGFTGRYLVRLLAEQGHEVHGIVHQPHEPIEGCAALHFVDLADHSEIRRTIRSVRPEKVVHLAAIAFVGHGNVEEMYRSNVVGTRQLLDALAGLETAPLSTIVASSANIYGNARAGVLDEDTPVAPANDYGVTKAAVELLCRLYAGKLPLIVTRPFNYTGVGQPDNFLVPKIVRHFRDRAASIELGNIDVSRDFSDIRTVVDAYARLLACGDAAGGTFNISSGKAIALREVIEICSRITGHSIEIRVNPDFVRADEVHTLAGSAARLEAAIGPLSKISLEDTLRWMLEG